MHIDEHIMSEWWFEMNQLEKSNITGFQTGRDDHLNIWLAISQIYLGARELWRIE